MKIKQFYDNFYYFDGFAYLVIIMWFNLLINYINNIIIKINNNTIQNNKIK